MLTRNLGEAPSRPGLSKGSASKPTSVSVLGLGAGALGESRVSEAEAEALLGRAVELGITFVDTAPSYGSSEERIGAFLRRSSRRDAVILSTKGGYGVPSVPDWTPEVLTKGIDQALARLGVSHIDVFFLHSCGRDVLARGDLFAPLARAKDAGKIRLAGYSGENEALDFAVDCGHFDVVQCSVNPFDQRSLANAIARAHARGIGVVGKRSMANAPWRFTERPVGNYCEEYWERMRAMDLDPSPLGWAEAALRFSAFAEGVSTVLVGTSSPKHLEECASFAEKGPLPTELQKRIRTRFYACDRGFIGQI